MDNTELRAPSRSHARTRALARGLARAAGGFPLCHQCGPPMLARTGQGILTRKSNGSPLRGHFSFEANRAAPLMWKACNPTPKRTRAGWRARWRAGWRARRAAPLFANMVAFQYCHLFGKHILVWKPTWSPLRRHFSLQANMAAPITWNAGNPTRMVARTLARTLARAAGGLLFATVVGFPIITHVFENTY